MDLAYKDGKLVAYPNDVKGIPPDEPPSSGQIDTVTNTTNRAIWVKKDDHGPIFLTASGSGRSRSKLGWDTCRIWFRWNVTSSDTSLYSDANAHRIQIDYYGEQP